MAKDKEQIKKETSDIQGVIDGLNKLLGDNSVVSFEDSPHNVEVVSSGSIGLDMALGGGYPLGRIIEIYGAESSGKTTLAIEAMIRVQRMGFIAVMLDNENAFDPAYAKNLGLDMSRKKMIFSQPDSGEDTFTILEALVTQPQVGIIVVDSIAAMTPRAEMEGEFGEAKMGLHAKLMSQGLRKLVGKIKQSNTLVIFINQTREKIGVMFGNPETTTGGNAMKFYASQRIRTSKAQGTKDKAGDLITNICTAKIVKNKIAPPHREATFHIRFGQGIDTIGEVLEYGVELGIIERAGAYYKYKSTTIGQGSEAAHKTLEDNPELTEELYNKIIAKVIE